MYRCAPIEINADSLLQKIEVKELFSLRWVAILLLFVISFNGYGQETSLDNYSGNWTDDATWLDGSAPLAGNIEVDITIYGYVTSNENLLTNDGDDLTITINDTLVIRGDFSLGNKTNLVIGPNAILIVDGNYSSGAQVNVGNDGKIIITGTVDISNSNQTDFENSGDLYVFDVDGSDFNEDKIPDFDCEPVTNCGVMEEDDLAVNDPDLSDFFEDVINPNLAPVITSCAADRTLSADASCQAVVPNLTVEIVATDDGTISSITQSPAAGSVIGLGVTTISITVTDDGGNTAACSAGITVVDITAPVISGCPTDITVTANDDYCGNTVTWTAPTATDNCNVTLTSTHNPGDFFNVGTTTVTYTAEDDAGNTATCSFDVTVGLPAGPVITGETEVCTPVEATYSIAPVAGKSYLWTVTNGLINGSNTGTEVSIAWSGNTTGTVTATIISGSGCSVSSTENIIQNETPVTGEIQSSGKLTRR